MRLFITRLLSTLFLLTLPFVLLACLEDSVATYDQAEAMSFSQIDDKGNTLVTVPLSDVGGSVDNVGNYQIEIYKNDIRINSLEANEYYKEEFVAVQFYLSGVKTGDLLKLNILDSSGAENAFSANISAEGDSMVLPDSNAKAELSTSNP